MKGREEKKKTKEREKESEKEGLPGGLVIAKSPANADSTCPGTTKPQLLRPLCPRACALQ